MPGGKHSLIATSSASLGSIARAEERQRDGVDGRGWLERRSNRS